MQSFGPLRKRIQNVWKIKMPTISQLHPVWRKVLVLQGRGRAERDGRICQLWLKFFFCKFCKNFWPYEHIASIPLWALERALLLTMLHQHPSKSTSCSPLGKGRENKAVWNSLRKLLRAGRGLLHMLVLKIKTRDFPTGPMVKTPCF